MYSISSIGVINFLLMWTFPLLLFCSKLLFCNKHFDSKFYAFVSLCKTLVPRGSLLSAGLSHFFVLLTVWHFSFILPLKKKKRNNTELFCHWLYLNMKKAEKTHCTSKNALLDFCSKFFSCTNYCTRLLLQHQPVWLEVPTKRTTHGLLRVFTIATCPSLSLSVAPSSSFAPQCSAQAAGCC